MVVNRDGGFIREVVAGAVAMAVDEISGVDVRMNEDEDDEVVVVDVN